MSLKPMLCDTCIFVNKYIEEFEKPIHPRSDFTHKVKCLVYYCKRKKKLVTKYVVSCTDYQNTTLIELIK